jgi:hypothetical protein
MQREPQHFTIDCPTTLASSVTFVLVDDGGAPSIPASISDSTIPGHNTIVPSLDFDLCDPGEAVEIEVRILRRKRETPAAEGETTDEEDPPAKKKKICASAVCDLRANMECANSRCKTHCMDHQRDSDEAKPCTVTRHRLI